MKFRPLKHRHLIKKFQFGDIKLPISNNYYQLGKGDILQSGDIFILDLNRKGVPEFKETREMGRTLYSSRPYFRKNPIIA